MSGVEVISLLAAKAAAAATAAKASAAAISLSQAATGASALFSVVSGIQGMQAARGEAAQVTGQMEIEKTRAAQEEADRQRRLTQILNDSLAVGSSSGSGALGSGSDMASTGFSQEEAARESRIASLDSKFRQDQLRMQRAQIRMGGKASLIRGFAGAASSVASSRIGSFERTRTV
jgi:hypothetical protein